MAAFFVGPRVARRTTLDVTRWFPADNEISREQNDALGCLWLRGVLVFEDSLFESAGRIRPRRGLTTAASLALQSLLFATVVLLSLVRSDVLPEHLRSLGYEFILPPPPSRAAGMHAGRVAASEIREGRILMPRRIPSLIVRVVEARAPSAGSIIDVPYGTGEGAADGVLHGILSPGGTPPLLPPKLPVERLRVSQGVVEGLLVHQVKPVYPSLAMQAHTQGNVVLHAIIGRDGAILSLQLVSGHPLLAPAAIDAVRQWRYRPYTLNGEPAEVETMVTVRFVLGN